MPPCVGSPTARLGWRGLFSRPLSALGNDIRPDALCQLRAEVLRSLPNDVPEMFGIEVHTFQFVFPACPNDLAPQAARKTRFKIHPAPLASEVRDYELCEPDLRHDSIGDAFVSCDLPHAHNTEPAFPNRRFDAQVIYALQGWIE